MQPVVSRRRDPQKLSQAIAVRRDRQVLTITVIVLQKGCYQVTAVAKAIMGSAQTMTWQVAAEVRRDCSRQAQGPATDRTY